MHKCLDMGIYSLRLLSLTRKCESFFVSQYYFSKGISSRTIGSDPSQESVSFCPKDNLKKRILNLEFSRYSAADTIRRWIDEGNRVNPQELLRIAKNLEKSRRDKHALEVLSWMETQGSFKISAFVRARRLNLIIKVHSLADAENYFETIRDRSSQKVACLPLLNYYVKERDVKKAESFMFKLQHLGLTVNPHSFNEMMKLYAATNHMEKVISVMKIMKCNNIRPNILSYNLWMLACCDVFGVKSSENVYREMMSDNNVEVCWSSLCTLANIYIKSRMFGKAFTSLKACEEKLSRKNRLGYFFIITLYAKMKDRDGVCRVWEASKLVPGRMTCNNYMSILLCLLRVGDVEKAEAVFDEWEYMCMTYDIRVCNVLLGFYVRQGIIDKAERLYYHALEKGGCPNYKTWEILMEGWVKKRKLDKAIHAMYKGLACLTSVKCEAKQKMMIKLQAYKLLFRTLISDGIKAPNVIHIIEKYKIGLDEEALALMESLKKLNSA